MSRQFTRERHPAPIHRGIAPFVDVARRTHAFMSRTRTSSTGIPPKKNLSPGESLMMNDSSTVPSVRPRT